MKRDDHVCTAYCAIYSYQEVCPVTCNPLHTQMLQGIASKRSYPYAQPERTSKKEKESKKPPSSTTQLAKQVTSRLPGAKQVSPVTRKQPRTASPDRTGAMRP